MPAPKLVGEPMLFCWLDVVLFHTDHYSIVFIFPLSGLPSSHMSYNSGSYIIFSVIYIQSEYKDNESARISTHTASVPRSKCVKTASVRSKFFCVRFEINKQTLFIACLDPVRPISHVQIQAVID
jgi:hypothetical protein